MSCTTIWRAQVLSEEFKAIIDEHESWIDNFFDIRESVAWPQDGLDRIRAMSLWEDETIEMMFLRLCLILCSKEGLDSVESLYDRFTGKEFNLSTAAFKNMGRVNNQAASCFVSTMEDAFEHQQDALRDISLVLKNGSAEGVGLSRIRANGSMIGKTKIPSRGPVSMVRRLSHLVENIYSHPGKTSDAAVYLDLWHSDIEEFLKCAQEISNLSFGVMIPNLFYDAIKNKKDWYLFSPHTLKGIDSTYGEEFNAIYERGVKDGLYTKKIDPGALNNIVVNTMTSVGRLFVIFKDNANHSNNQRGFGTINNFNLCAEISQVTDEHTKAVCTLGTMCFPTFVVGGRFDFEKFQESARVLTRVVDSLVDLQTYHNKSAKRGAKWRAIGLGGSGLASVFFKLGLEYESDEARVLNAQIYETLQYAALMESVQLAIERGTHEDYEKTLLAKGILGWETYPKMDSEVPKRCDWEALRALIKQHGVRNSLVTAQMPTAGSSIVMGNTPSFEPQYGNVVNRMNMSGTKPWINPLLCGLDKKTLAIISDNEGSVENIESLKHLRGVCKTVFEMDDLRLVQMQADRQRYICQSQSYNLFLAPSDDVGTKIAKILYRSNQLGNKTGSYYTHIQHVMKPMSFMCNGGACSI